MLKLILVTVVLFAISTAVYAKSQSAQVGTQQVTAVLDANGNRADRSR